MTLLRSVLTAAAALSIAQAVVKIAELLLDDRQQKAFQTRVYALELRLIDVNPIQHYRRMSERKVQIKLELFPSAWRGYATTAAVLWACVTMLSLADPGYGERVESIKKLTEIFRGGK